MNMIYVRRVIRLVRQQNEKTDKNENQHIFYLVIRRHPILGHWSPFTPDIKLQFLSALQTKDLYDNFQDKVIERCKIKGKLLTLNSTTR